MLLYAPKSISDVIYTNTALLLNKNNLPVKIFYIDGVKLNPTSVYGVKNSPLNFANVQII